MPNQLLIKLKDGRVGLGEKYRRKGETFYTIDGRGFSIDNLKEDDVESAVFVEDKLPKKPTIYARGGDAIEHDILSNLKSSWNDFMNLKQTHPQHGRQFLDGIHQCQQVMMWREIQRLKPEKYPTYDGN